MSGMRCLKMVKVALLMKGRTNDSVRKVEAMICRNRQVTIMNLSELL